MSARGGASAAGGRPLTGARRRERAWSWASVQANATLEIWGTVRPVTARTVRIGGGRAWEAPTWMALAAVSASVAILVAGRGSLAAAGVGAALLVVLLLLTTPRTGTALAVVVLYLGVADGYVKLRTGVGGVTLVRDVLLYAVVAGVLLRASVRATELETPPLAGWVILIVALVLVQLANPGNASAGKALAGLRPHLEFVPLYFLAFWTVRDARALRTTLIVLLSIGAINGVVTYVQSTLTPQQLAAWGPGYEERVLGEGRFAGGGRAFYDRYGDSRVRPLGLGSDAGFAGQFGVLAIPAGLALLGIAGSARLRILAVVLIALTVAGVVTSQTRAGIVASVVAAVAFGALATVSRRWWTAGLGLVAGLLVAVVTVSLVTSRAQIGAFDRYGTFTPNQVLRSTQKERPTKVIGEYLAKYPLGAGIGKSGPAAGFGGTTASLNSETEFTYLTNEIGIPGLLAFLGFHLALVSLVVRRCRRVADGATRTMLAALGAPLVAMLPLWFVTTTTANTPFSPFIWFTGGVLAFWLVALPRRPAPSP
jgi:hypothetical protein